MLVATAVDDERRATGGGRRGVKHVDAATKRQVSGEIEFSPFTEHDLADISRLISGMSDDDEGLQLRDKSAAYYRWMYYDNPAGPALGFLARHGDRIVSSFAVAPKVMQVGGRRVRVGKTMDMFTDPDYQGMGLIKQCAERVFAAAREAGVDGWYVTPSVNSYPIFTGKWGYREDFDVIYRARIIDLEAVLTAAQPRLGRAVGRIANAVFGPLLRRSPKLPAGCTVTELPHFDEQTDALWEEVAAGYGVAIVRDADLHELALRRQSRRVHHPGPAPCRIPRGHCGDQDDAQAGPAGRGDR